MQHEGVAEYMVPIYWTKGCSPAASCRSIRVDSKLNASPIILYYGWSIELTHPSAPPCTTPLLNLRLPNLRAATEEQKVAFTSRLHARVEREKDQLQAAASCDDASTLSTLASHLTLLTRRCAASTLPVTGATPYKSRGARQLQRQLIHLTRLLSISHTLLTHRALGTPTHAHLLTHSPEWRKEYTHCVQQYDLNGASMHGTVVMLWLGSMKIGAAST